MRQKSIFKLPSLKVGLLLTLSVVLVAGVAFPTIRNAFADATCSSISDCQQQITNNDNSVAQLQNQATSYQDAIDHLNAQIDQLQVTIDASVTEQANIQQQIQQGQTQIAQQKQVLGSDIKAMYVDGQLTTIEELATSKNLSDFVDAQTYRNAVQSKIQDTLSQISTLEAQLQTQQQQVQALILSQKDQQAQVVAAQNQQQQLLSYNQTQQAAYNAQTSLNEQKLNGLIAAQLSANESASPGGYFFIHFPGAITHDPGSNGGNLYPYSSAGFEMSTAPGCTAVNPGDGPDPWGYCMRQCVSYAAWAVAYSGRQAPVGWGNAKDWVGAAKNAGIPFDSSPEPGDVAISTEGTWGHAMYVEQVSGNQMFVSEYNQQLTGQFSTQWRAWE